MGSVFVFVMLNAFEEVVETNRGVQTIKLVNHTAIAESNRHAVLLAANVNGNVQLVLHEVLPRSGKTDKPSARLAYSRATTTGIIPSGVTDDADDGGGISGVSMIVANQTGPLSHTPVNIYPTPIRRIQHLANSESRPL
jgi:hypothetical protein